MNKLPLFIPLDNMSLDKAIQWAKMAQSFNAGIKVGMELFYREGPHILKVLKDNCSGPLFLDLKLYDIPNTVGMALKSLRDFPVDYLTLHLSGGEEMLKAAKEAKEEFCSQTKLLGVSVLTSFSEEDIKKNFNQELKEALQTLIKNALNSKIEGVICSPLDLPQVNNIDIENDLIKVCPGIRFQEDSNQDQKRTSTPFEAWKTGAEYIVMGRSITMNSHPEKVLTKLTQIYKDLNPL